MCGIVGSVGILPAKEIMVKACDSIAHRGPDDSGLYYSEKEQIALGHRRLSIIDLSKDGHQPFLSADARYAVIFNGEIYNYIEIKKDLEGFYNFITKTDTEVLLAAYIKWGERCVEKFNGMFAFAIWDAQEKKLFCARDRLGEKPFFYNYIVERFFFASEVKALLSLGVRPEANEAIIFDYLHFGVYDHSDETFFKNIKILSPGHYLVWENNTIEIKKYWDLADVPIVNYSSDSEIEEKFRFLLSDSISIRFRSDVPVGVNLSSGLDSNSLYHYALQVTGDKLHTFSMCLESEEYNECDVIGEILNGKQKEFWHSCYLKPEEVLSGAEQMNKIQDQPFGGIPTIAYNSLIGLADANNVTVLLEGQGVDEILAGYPYYKMELEKDELNLTGGGDSITLGQDMSKLVNQGILNNDFTRCYHDRRLQFFRPFTSNLLNAQYRDIRYTKLPRVLRFNDHVTMFHGKELRLPFLDYRIVEFCFGLPAKYKIRNGSHKFLLRKIMNGIIPKKIMEKEKKVFGAIQTEWFRKYFRAEIMNLLESQSFRSRVYWDQIKMRQEVENFFKGEIQNSFFIWQCFNLDLWFKNFID